ncbi:hypothetical protein [Rickettsia endosymbiont of Orchestes rusci]|uniref:hypothetical protein n=1 Tax=Rickettsia endosymbiont of Orchestes rusci TaxID=3066250 RepID=UPI00313B69A6
MGIISEIIIASDWRRCCMANNFRIMVIISTVSYRGLTHYCTNVEKRLCHAVT